VSASRPRAANYLVNAGVPTMLGFPCSVIDATELPRSVRCEPLRWQEIGQRADGHYEAVPVVLFELGGIQQDLAQLP
jgi:hypothetical protein